MIGKTLIIAEAGVNHNGSLELAKRLVDAAALAGVDYVKFQSFKADKLVTRQAKQADYQKENFRIKDDSQYEMLKKLELSAKQHEELICYCKRKGVAFFSTAFDLESINYLSSLHLGLWKIPSGEITNYPYLKRIAQFREPVILSTGMSDLEEIRQAVNVLLSHGLRKDLITILHCNTEYPTPMNDVNLKAMHTISKELGIRVGYSDHTVGIEVPIAAVTLGAVVIEKHFTLDRNLEGPDHKASLEPRELEAMVKAIRNIEQALGIEQKIVTNSESKNKSVARKSIVAAKAISKGELLTEENLSVKRPGDGISPMNWEKIVGTYAVRAFEIDEQITLI